jgi:hypothetical protein
MTAPITGPLVAGPVVTFFPHELICGLRNAVVIAARNVRTTGLPAPVAILGERSGSDVEVLGDFGGRRQRRYLIRHDRRS